MSKIPFLVFCCSVSISSFSQLQYVQVENTPLFDIQESTITKLDVEGDGDMDFIITGVDDFNMGRCELFVNNGNLDFTLVEDLSLLGVRSADVAVGDVDGDGAIDVFVSGFFELEYLSQLFLNDGDGNFTLSDENEFAPMINTHSVFFDADGDEDLDLIYSGQNPNTTKSTRLYLNDGDGIFTEDASPNFIGTDTGDLAVADINNDGDVDVLVIGLDTSGDRQVQMYLNDEGTFSTLDTDFPAMSACSIEFFDANGDEYIDVLLSGSAFGPNFTNVFINNGDETFALLPENDFDSTYNCHSAITDIDDDGDLDVMINGVIEPNQECTLYINDGTGIFTEDTEELYLGSPSQNGEIAFEDFDGDGTPEFLITGFYQPESRIAKLYTLDKTNAIFAKSELAFTLFPNPSQGMMSIDTELNFESVQVLDATGKLVIENAWENGKVNCEKLPTGNYTLVIEMADGVSSQNVVIQR